MIVTDTGSSATVTGNTIEDNTGNGLVLKFGASATIEDNTIQNNYRGFYLLEAQLGYGKFEDNHVVGNTLEGLYLADMSTLWMQNAFNEIKNNGQHEIYLVNDTQARLYAGDGEEDGHNDIYDTSHDYGPYYLIYNLAKDDQNPLITWKIPAQGNYWDEDPPEAWMFFPTDGKAVDYANPHTQPHVMGPQIQAPLALSSTEQQFVKIEQEIRVLLQQLEKEPEHAETPLRLRALREWLLLAGDAVPARWHDRAEALYATFSQALLQQAPSFSSEIEENDLAGELAMLFQVQDALLAQDYEEALSLAASFEPYVVNKDLRTGLLIDEVIAHTHLGAFEAALSALDLAEAIAPDAALVEHYTAPDYEPVRTYLLQAIAEDTTSTATVAAVRQVAKQEPVASAQALEAGKLVHQDVVATSAPRKVAVEGVYPNPFNPRATIQYTLPEASQVLLKVYDVQGREVATLVQGEQGAGRYTAVYDARSLASGLYVYRLEAVGKVITGTMLLMK